MILWQISQLAKLAVTLVENWNIERRLSYAFHVIDYDITTDTSYGYCDLNIYTDRRRSEGPSSTSSNVISKF